MYRLMTVAVVLVLALLNTHPATRPTSVSIDANRHPLLPALWPC